ncbi:Outer envelope protein 64, mitochondrial [Sesamum angolense]|uniref:Outer envelope protein 64, mitochondrial n=1 Tax=Sesamum angolense TaxID=2727404 RepID=A0AAE1WY58_9LAMI|nr:Outer envelope protein 64, mitochondrial [Sesamum angolense]
MSKLSKLNASNPKVWLVIGVGLAGVLILAEVQRRRITAKNNLKEDFGAFIERFELLPSPQPPPPAARLLLSGLTFAVNDNFDIKGYITGYGSADWKRTHVAAGKTAVVVTTLLRSGATCLGKTVMDELGFGILGENKTYGTPINPAKPSHVPGGSSSGSAVAVAAQIVDFALGTDTIGCLRVPASFCGILGFRPSHGIVSTVGVLPNSQRWLASDPSVLHRVGHALLKLNLLEPKRTRRIIIADDLFQLSKVPLQKTVIASNVPSLKSFHEESEKPQIGISTLRALSSAMLSLQRYEFRTNNEEWIKSAKPKLGPDVSNRVWAAVNATQEDVKSLYKVRMEMRAAVQSLLKWPILHSSGIPRKVPAEYLDRMSALLSIANMSGGCQVAIPFGKHDESPISVSFIASHGMDKFLLDTVLDMHSSLQEEVSAVSSFSPLPYTNGNMDAAELLKEKLIVLMRVHLGLGFFVLLVSWINCRPFPTTVPLYLNRGNAAYKGKQWNKAVSYYTEAIKLNDANATFYSNRAAAYLELGCFQQAEEDCSMAISLDKKYVKAYLRRGTARESLLFYREALQDFKHALVLEPQNKVASLAEKRLRKLTS